MRHISTFICKKLEIAIIEVYPNESEVNQSGACNRNKNKL